MTDTASSPSIEIPQDARDMARELGWADGMIEAALGGGFSLQEVWQALKAGVTGEQAQALLAGGSMVKPDLSWMKVPTEWGIRARPSQPEMGLTIGDLMIGTYGDVPDVWTNRTEIARGSFPAPSTEDMGYTIFDKSVVWADNCVPLYEAAIKDRWSSATDLNWKSLEPISDDVERAICQLMTELSDRSYAQATLIGKWFPEISYGFIEAKLYLSTVVYDLARHAEAFRKRALSNGGGLGIQPPTDYTRAAWESRSFPELAAIMFVQDSMLLTLYRHGEQLAQNEMERDLYALAARDRQRFMDYHIERLKHYLFKFVERRGEHEHYFAKAESRVAKEWRDATVAEPLAIILGGGRDNIAEGQQRLADLRRVQVQDYIDNLAKATYFRGRLNARFQEALEPAGAPA